MKLDHFGHFLMSSDRMVEGTYSVMIAIGERGEGTAVAS